MKCPECESEMEGEPIREVRSVASPGTVYKNSTVQLPHHDGTLHGTTHHFYCGNCDSEWTLERKKWKKIDGADFAVPLDQIVKKEHYH